MATNNQEFNGVEIPRFFVVKLIMIKSEIVEIKYTNDNIEIESELRKMGIEPLRWAIVAVKGEKFLISVSF